MSCVINASTSAGLVQTADLSGQLALQANGTTVATASSSGLAISTYNPSASLITSGTAVASTSGTSIDFTGIPSWVKRVTIMFNGVSTNGTSTPWLVRIGPSGGVETTGYLGSSSAITTTTTSGSNNTTGFAITVDNSAACTLNGSLVLSLLNFSTNTWTALGILGQSDRAFTNFLGYTKPLAGPLSIVRITTTGGTDAFDAGSINILYE
jgi:hypothetical protein